MARDLGVAPHNMSTCSPLVVGDLVFAETSNGIDGDHEKVPRPEAPSFIAADKRTGKLVWKDASPGKGILHGQWSSPSYGVIGGVPQVIFPGGDGWLRAFDPAGGRPLWKLDGNPPGARYDPEGKGDASLFVATAVDLRGEGVHRPRR